MKRDHLFPEIQFRLPDYNLEDSTLTLENLKWVLMERILENGTRKEVCWLLSHYRKRDFLEFLSKHGIRKLSRLNQIFWFNFFGLDPPAKCGSLLWKS